MPVFNRFDGSRDNVAKRLQAGGYHTGMIGKWHLGSDPTGFDRWIVLPGQGAYWDPSLLVPGHKLIYYWDKDAYELFDLTKDPMEQHNLLFSEEEAKSPDVEKLFAELKAEIVRLQKDFKDDGQYADSSTWPRGGVHGPFPDKRPIGEKSVAEAIAASVEAGSGK